MQEFLDGAHNLDEHFIEMNPRHNLPVLLALADVWNDTFLKSSARVVTPFSDAFSGYASFVGALEAQTCCRASTSSAASVSGGISSGGSSCSAAIVDAGLDGSFDRAFYQSSKVMNTELIMTLDSQIEFNASLGSKNSSLLGDVYSAQDALVCSIFAHADELAFGYKRAGGDTLLSSPSSPNAVPEADTSEGNRPSLLVIVGKMDAFACGQLVAMSEHRAVVKAHIWGLDPFVREVGSALRMYRTDQLKEDLQDLFRNPDGAANEDDEGGPGSRMNLSTKTILTHYASLVKGQRRKN